MASSAFKQSGSQPTQSPSEFMDRFSTEWLIAERLHADHLPDLVVRISMPRCRVISAECARRWRRRPLDVNMAHWDQHGFGLWALRTKDGAFAGRSGIRHILVDDVDEIEIAYTFKREFWVAGLASQIASALTDIGLAQLELPSLVGLVFVGHVASRRVLEKANYVLDDSSQRGRRDLSHQTLRTQQP
ncbi:GNAT family N-acetyltransferase [Bradyrhizobium sp. ORS 3257]|uniref:Acetyltransferase, ribosomal protein N-acetylase n=1 Tax=Bradyrhizobium vignae TaxID=1549949 RepID=A0A2U3PXD6_9BRAD|nr:Acetyltransferase, ribosomal protein N-acetylase [Bradyrhizobium vignae]